MVKYILKYIDYDINKMNFYFNLNVPNYIHVMCFLYIRYNNALKLYIYIYIYIQ